MTVISSTSGTSAAPRIHRAAVRRSHRPLAAVTFEDAPRSVRYIRPPELASAPIFEPSVAEKRVHPQASARHSTSITNRRVKTPFIALRSLGSMIALGPLDRPSG